MDVLTRFEGELAEEHVLPAYEGAQSIEGIARTLTLVSSYVATGEVRKRFPFDETISVRLKHTRPGSFESVFGLITDPNSVLATTAVGGLAVTVAGALVYDFTKLLVRRLTGVPDGDVPEEVEKAASERPGELEALGEAVEPAVLKAHSVINNGAGNIVIVGGERNVINLNARTKSYMKTSILDDHPFEKRVSVGMLNANTRYGRVFDAELGRTVPISVPRDATPRTLGNLAESLQRYSSRTIRGDSDVTITATKLTALDGTVKKYIVTDAVF